VIYFFEDVKDVNYEIGGIVFRLSLRSESYSSFGFVCI